MKKVISIIIMCTFILSSFVISVHAGGNDGIISGPIDITEDTEIRQPLKESYTLDELYSILAGDHNFDIPEEGLEFTPENFPLDTGDASTMANITYPSSGTFYIACVDDGKLFAYLSRDYLCKMDYADETYMKWVFHLVNGETYIIRPYSFSDVALESLPTAKAELQEYNNDDDPYFHWKIIATDKGVKIRSDSGLWPMDGTYLHYESGLSFSLSTTEYTEVALINLEWWVPTTSVDIDDYYSIAVNETRYINASVSPYNAVPGSSWISYTIADPVLVSVTSSACLVGHVIGNTTITARHKITGASDTANIYIGYRVNLRLYYDNACADYCEAQFNEGVFYSSIPVAMINSWMEPVKEKYARDFRINLKIISMATLYATYPEQTDAQGNMVCANGDNYAELCTCTTRCNDSSSTPNHHKNIYNIYRRLPLPDSSQNLSIYFTGHNICSASNTANGCDPKGPSGLANSNLGVCLIAPNNESFCGDHDDEENDSEPNVDKIPGLVAHELGHLFTAPDHYNGKNGLSSNPELDQDEDCIYGENKMEQLYDITTCIGCTRAILQNADKYNHS